jgi:DNA ligase (NAD+)
MGKKSAANVVASIAASKSRIFERLITGLGIEHIGQVAARQLAEVAGSLEALLGYSEAELRERLEGVSGFGPKMVESVLAYVRDPENRKLLEGLRDRGVSAPQPRVEAAAEGPLQGLYFCVTGVLSRRREDVHQAIRDAAGEVHDKVKQGTTYLVAGEKVGKSKLDTARKRGVRVIDEATLERLLKGEKLEP